MIRRLDFVQWLRVFLIALVVAHHAGQPYGPTGGEWPVHDPAQTVWLGAFFTVNAAFFMGFFFLIAGYFTASSHDRKGTGPFVRDRLIRLGIPLAFFTFLVYGPVAYFLGHSGEGFFSFYFGTYLGRWQIEMGPLWFVAQLLAYSLIYAAWRRWFASAPPVKPAAAPHDRAVLAYVLVLGIVGALVRTRYPQDAWVRILWLIPAEPAHLPQYVSLFVIGIVAGRGQWFTTVSTAVCVRWFAVGLVAFLAALGLFVFKGALPAGIDLGVIWGLLEAFVCVGMILGLTALFRARFDRPGHWLARLDANVYGVYLIHIFVLVALQMAILGQSWPATVKFLVVTLAGLVLSFTLVAAFRRIAIVRRAI